MIESVFQDPALQRQNSQAIQTGAAAIHMAKNALNGGEMDPAMGARFDQQRLQTGCRELLNMVPMPTGGVTRRPGTEHVMDLGNPLGLRLIPFIFSESQSRLCLLVHDGQSCKMRVFHADGSGGDIRLTLPYGADDLAQLSYAQSADVIYLAHPKWPPARIMRYADDDWCFAEIDWLPQIPAPGAPGLAQEGTSTDAARADQTYVVTAIDGETGEESMPSPAAVIRNVPPLSSSLFVRITVTPLANASEYRVYRRHAGVFGYIGRITEPADDEWVFEDRNIAPDETDTPPNWKNPFANGNYPSIVFLHQQRLGFAASDRQPLTLWLSQAGAFESMASSVPPDDDDAIEATLAAPQANRILWACPDRTALALDTEGGEWLFSGSENSPISPANISFQPQTRHGSQPGVEPLQCGSSLTFVQRGGRCVREFSYSFAEDRYASTDLSLLARHITAESPIIDWASQPEPLGILWCALKDGSMAGLTYMREHEVIAWHRHETSGRIVGLETIPDGDGAWRLWLLAERADPDNPENVRICLERMRTFCADKPPSDARHFTDGLNESPFRCVCSPWIPDAAIEDGTSFLRIKKLNSLKARVINSSPFFCQVISQNARPSPVMKVPAQARNEPP